MALASSSRETPLFIGSGGPHFLAGFTSPDAISLATAISFVRSMAISFASREVLPQPFRTEDVTEEEARLLDLFWQAAAPTRCNEAPGRMWYDLAAA
jgi:hypothetical protein